MASNEDYDKIFAPLDGGEDSIQIRDKKMTEAFRRLFSTSDGKIVLHQLLLDLKFYDPCETDAEKALNNYAKFMIFKRLGCNNDMQISDAIFDCRKEI